MGVYVGYGFHVSDITPSQWLGLVMRFDQGLYDEILEEARENNPNEGDITFGNVYAGVERMDLKYYMG